MKIAAVLSLYLCPCIKENRNGGSLVQFTFHSDLTVMILYSVLNMKLRDFYGSLDALCDDMDADKQALLETMAKVGFHYDPERNAFV